MLSLSLEYRYTETMLRFHRLPDTIGRLCLNLCIISSLLPLNARLASGAISTSACHCFKDRAYNPRDRFAADDYILTTSFNSLISKTFGIEKQRIVMLKMQGGIAPDDLLIGLKLAQNTKADLDSLLSRRKSGTFWSTIMRDLDISAQQADDEFYQALKAGVPAVSVGGMIAREMIAGLFGLSGENIQQMLDRGLDEKAITLVAVLAHRSGNSPASFVDQYQKEKKSWSEIADGLGVSPKAAGKLILQYPEKKLPE